MAACLYGNKQTITCTMFTLLCTRYAVTIYYPIDCLSTFGCFYNLKFISSYVLNAFMNRYPSRISVYQENELCWCHSFYDHMCFMNVAAMSRQKKLAFDALSRHGYRGGPSVLKVPPPKEPEKEPDWSWSTGKDRKTENKHGDNDGSAESYEERERTRAALVRGETLLHAAANKMEREKEKKSFSQKEKRKRDLGQTSRGKNYVEEEKRLLRDNGVYSGFD
ncbi:UPF0690 protein [Rhynchospora pubera]|uniref:UPF0690 protein n=1 Tax=Rhynchospora pubera TaxID=906938 RepID=A0AAV8CCN9_9POAL|nr:UPF0690 protein [Rhynchospora pubera]